jgi:phosphohistidine phosphatase
MLKLFLLRHAQAANDFTIDDHDRPLTPHGLKQAENIAKHLPQIDLALCSDACRTRSTLEVIEKTGTAINKAQYLNSFYNAPAGELLAEIQNSGTAKNLLVVAHNPGIHQCAVMLSKQGDNMHSNQLIFGYPPASLSIFEYGINDWKNIQPQGNKLIDLIIPN